LIPSMAAIFVCGLVAHGRFGLAEGFCRSAAAGESPGSLGSSLPAGFSVLDSVSHGTYSLAWLIYLMGDGSPGQEPNVKRHSLLRENSHHFLRWLFQSLISSERMQQAFYGTPATIREAIIVLYFTNLLGSHSHTAKTGLTLTGVFPAPLSVDNFFPLQEVAHRMEFPVLPTGRFPDPRLMFASAGNTNMVLCSARVDPLESNVPSPPPSVPSQDLSFFRSGEPLRPRQTPCLRASS